MRNTTINKLGTYPLQINVGKLGCSPSSWEMKGPSSFCLFYILSEEREGLKFGQIQFGEDCPVTKNRTYIPIKCEGGRVDMRKKSSTRLLETVLSWLELTI